MAERTVLRDAIRNTLLRAGAPAPTMAIVSIVGDHETFYAAVYRELRAMERAGEIQRAGRVGPAASCEVLWRLAPSSGVFNQVFAGLLALDDQGVPAALADRSPPGTTTTRGR